MIDFKGLPCSIAPAPIVSGSTTHYWKVIEALALTPDETGGLHHIYVRCLDTSGARVFGATVDVYWPTDHHTGTTERKDESERGDFNFPMFGSWNPQQGLGPYNAWVVDLNPSETVQGMGLPNKRHYTFKLVYQLTPVDQDEQEGETFDQMFFRLGATNQKIRLNPSAALQKVIFAGDFVPTSEEFTTTWEGISWVAQLAESLESGEVRVYRCPVGEYDKVDYIVRPY